MAEQLVFDLPVREALGRDDFFVAPSNALAVETLDRRAEWPQRKLILIGPKGAGKSHLVQVWAAETGGAVLSARGLQKVDLSALAGHVAVEDADRLTGDPAAETALFHLHNLLAAQGGFLLLTAALPPSQWAITLPDLASRMQATATARINLPDDSLLTAVLVKQFADRQLLVPASVIPYLVSRMERSFGAARALVIALDEVALARGSAVTRTLAAEVLDRFDRSGA